MKLAFHRQTWTKCFSSYDSWYGESFAGTTGFLLVIVSIQFRKVFNAVTDEADKKKKKHQGFKNAH
jgi:hypothetical protein